jgi:hypothetical protein
MPLDFPAAQLMSNLSSVLLDIPNPESKTSISLSKLEQALSWAQKAYDVICTVHEPNARTKKVTKESIVCDAALGSILFNLGMLMEVSRLLSLRTPRLISLLSSCPISTNQRFLTTQKLWSTTKTSPPMFQANWNAWKS